MFLEHIAGIPATPGSAARSDDPMLDPLLLGVLTAAVAEESTCAYQQGFRDGLRAAALLPDHPDHPDGAEATDPADEGDWHR